MSRPRRGLGRARVALAALVLVCVAGAPSAAQHHHRAAMHDARQPIRIPHPQQQAVLAEMRALLVSVSGIIRGIADGDLPAVEKAARAAGTSASVDDRMRASLPPAFLELGLKTHKGFDGIAQAAGAGASRDELLGRLAEVTATCTACHAGWRLAGH